MSALATRGMKPNGTKMYVKLFKCFKINILKIFLLLGLTQKLFEMLINLN